MIYTIYYVENGRIEKSVITDNIIAQIQDGYDYIDGAYDDDEFYIESGVPVALPNKPNEFCVFDYDTKQWVDPRTPETQWQVVRLDRNYRLQVTDWTQLADIYPETKALWEPYRQALRDVTEQSDPFNIIWPTPPA